MSAILLVVLAHRLWDFAELRQLTAELDRIRERGEPLSGADIRNEVPSSLASRDAGDYYAAAAVLTLSTGSALEVDAALAPVRGWIGGAGSRPSNLAATVAAVQGDLDEWTDALDLVDKAAGLPFGGFPPGTEFNYRAAGVSNLSRLAADRTIALSLRGDGDRAVESAVTELRLRRPLRELLWQATRGPEVAAILSFTTPSPSALRRLQDALEQEDDENAAADALVRERARFLDRVLSIFYGADPRATLSYPPASRRGAPTLARPLISRQLVEALQLWTELIDAARQPWPGRASLLNRIHARYPDEAPPPNTRSVGLTFSPFAPTYRRQVVFPLENARQAMRADILTVDRAARVAVAIERFRRDRGALPTRLDELRPTYLASLPDDPWTGGTLIYQLMADAYAVYSVGPDLEDNGGALMKAAPPTSATRYVAADDVGVRVLTSMARKGPAQPDTFR